MTHSCICLAALYAIILPNIGARNPPNKNITSSHPKNSFSPSPVINEISRAKTSKAMKPQNAPDNAARLGDKIGFFSIECKQMLATINVTIAAANPVTGANGVSQIITNTWSTRTKTNVVIMNAVTASQSGARWIFKLSPILLCVSLLTNLRS